MSRRSRVGPRSRLTPSWWLLPWLVGFALATIVTAAAASGAAAQDGPSPAQELADRYAPVLMVKAQTDECDAEGERFAPMSVDALLDNTDVLLRQVGSGNPVVQRGPGARDIHGLGGGFYLDYPGDALEPGCVYEGDYRRYSGGRSVVYAHIVADPDAGRLALQYWFFWYYNDWNNKHEGDWEGIQIFFDVGSVEEALTTTPVGVGYSQHEGGEWADWNDDKLELEGTHPTVYSSVGSHASYFGSALYLGRSGSEGFGCDSTDGPSNVIEPAVVVLPDAATDADDRYAWLGFEGRWGERQTGPFNGPTGPSTKTRWLDPFEWRDELRDSSVVVPGGDQGAAEVIGAFCGVVEWGSAQMITMKQNPLQLAGGLAVALALVAFALRRSDWSPVEPLPIVRRRRAGQIIKAAGRLYRSRPATFLTMGLTYIPVALATGLVVAILQRMPVIGALLASDGDVGAVGSFVTFGAGGLGHALALTIITAAVARYLRALDSDDPLGARAAVSETLHDLGGLASAAVRATIIVALLLVSVVGIPWGVRQLIRYQFIASTATLEDRRGQAALDRSAELVEGRWLHTAGVMALANALVAGLAILVGMALLLILADVPLWLFSIIVTASSALVVPVTAIVSVLLYGDAVAEANDAAPAEKLVTA
ncbi:MAG: Vps62-related protein [Acidimicrobiales bacterium]|nr:Vps62-related protein [Acidimicrobiales bacterium]